MLAACFFGGRCGPACPRNCCEPAAQHCPMSTAFVLGLQAGLQGSLCGLVNWRQQEFCMSAFGDWTPSVLVLCIAAAESDGGTLNLAERGTGQFLLMVACMRVRMVVGSCCFGLSLLPLFLAGTFFGPPLYYSKKKSLGTSHRSSNYACAHVCNGCFSHCAYDAFSGASQGTVSDIFLALCMDCGLYSW